jgi:hypothetical protein
MPLFLATVPIETKKVYKLKQERQILGVVRDYVTKELVIDVLSLHELEIIASVCRVITTLTVFSC